jgi:hypothetical protein
MSEKHSCHVFMFPFQLEWNKEVNWDSVKDSLKKCGWTSNLDDKPIPAYNAKKFFHQVAHPCLFESSDSLIRRFIFDQKKISGQEGLFYTIHINRRKPHKKIDGPFQDELRKPPENYEFEKKSYCLKIARISLDVYKQGIGIFSFHLSNDQFREPEDILLINQFGRRLFPPFLDECAADFNMSLDPLSGVQHREMPVSVSIGENYVESHADPSTIKNASIIYEDFQEDYNSKQIDKSYSEKLFLPGHIGYFFRDENARKLTNEKKFSFFGDEIKILGNNTLQYVLDDRMFVMCWYGAHQLNYDYRKLKKTLKEEEKEVQYAISGLCTRLPGGYEASGFSRNPRQHKALMLNRTVNGYGYSSDDFWYQFLFADGYAPACSNDLMKEDLIDQHTYARWVENNTLYGITRYSFVCITEPLKILKKTFPNAGFIVDNFRTIYFRMVSLALFQRTMVLKYSAEAASVSNMIGIKKGIDDQKQRETAEEELIDHVETLIKNYTVFINQVFHREITAQEQGIEMYDMLQQHLRIEYQAKELEKEIDEFHRTIDLIKTRQVNDSILESNKTIAYNNEIIAKFKKEEADRIKEEQKTQEQLANITKIGGAFIIPTILTALIQAKVLPDETCIYQCLVHLTENTNFGWLWYSFPYVFFFNTIIYTGIGISSLFILLINWKNRFNWVGLSIATFLYMLVYPCNTWICTVVLTIILTVSIRNLFKAEKEQKKNSSAS